MKRPDASYFVTFRLADSLPRNVLAAWAEERSQIEREIRSTPGTRAAAHKQALDAITREHRRRMEEALDAGAGSCVLRRPDIADLVAGSLRHFQGNRYHLEAWVVMPNHVHVLVKPSPEFALGRIVKSWKQFTATRANTLLNLLPGRFWQPESYDHWVRDDAERARIVRYIHRNPVKANLCREPADWRWSSAFGASNNTE